MLGLIYTKGVYKVVHNTYNKINLTIAVVIYVSKKTMAMTTACVVSDAIFQVCIFTKVIIITPRCCNIILLPVHVKLMRT